MSADQVELLREMYSRRTLAEFAEPLHPDAEMHQVPEIPDSDIYRGRDEFVRGVTRWLEEWETFRFETKEVEDLGDRILMSLLLVGRAKSSGIELEQMVFHVWTFRDGKPFRCQAFFDEQRAREVAGLEPLD